MIEKYTCPQCGRQNPTAAIECPRCHTGNPITGTSFQDLIDSFEVSPEMRAFQAADRLLERRMYEHKRLAV